MQDEVLQRRPAAGYREDVGSKPQQRRRPHRGDLRVAADDDGVGVVAGMAPAPDRRLAHDHETGELIDGVVHPARLERRAVAAFVPARIGRRTVEHAVADEERHRPPGAPEDVAAGPGQREGGEPDDGVADRRTVGALHQLLHPLARNVGLVPFGGRQPALNRGFGIAADQAVVASRRCHAARPCCTRPAGSASIATGPRWRRLCIAGGLAFNNRLHQIQSTRSPACVQCCFRTVRGSLGGRSPAPLQATKRNLPAEKISA